jgi:squalene-associated FAD-dependent desaturase
MTNQEVKWPRIAIIGGGLAGLAAAAALVDQGLAIELFEARRRLGGRAGSFVDPADGSTIDHCQHVAMGCCTNFLDFCRRTGIEGLLERHKRLYFFSPDGRRYDFEPSTWLPAPLHLAPALMGLGYLSLRDKLAIASAMQRLMRLTGGDDPDGPTVQEWLNRERQSPQTIERFWKVILVSALGESLERASIWAARKVFHDGFWAHRSAADVLVPRVTLHELYDERVGGWLRSQGVTVHMESPVEAIVSDVHRAAGLRLADGQQRSFDFVVLAVPWMRVHSLLSAEAMAAIDPNQALEKIAGAPISSVHLWFDRPITDLPHAVLIERLSQWVFNRPAARPGEHYYQVVISASYKLAGRERQHIIDEVLGNLASIFPPARQAQLIRWRLLTEHQAVFSMRPGIEALRPSQQTRIENLLLAGDWTYTGWPATMESAVRSGYLAADAILRKLNKPWRPLAPDLGRTHAK